MKKSILLTIVFILIICMSSVCAANWYTYPYEWARHNNLISAKTDKQLLANVTFDEFYTILFNYFEDAYVEPSRTMFKLDDYRTDNYILVATDRQLTTLAKKEWLTNEEYKKGATLIDNAQNIMQNNGKYFSDVEKDSIKSYLEIMDYILYTKIYDYEYKLQIAIKKPKNVDKFLEYNLLPYYGEITREEFLNLLYYYQVAESSTFTTGTMVAYYTGLEVLRGYDNNLMLSTKLNYAHLVTFLSRI